MTMIRRTTQGANGRLVKRSKALGRLLMLLFAVTIFAGTHEILRVHASRKWVVIDLPDPPKPLPYDTDDRLTTQARRHVSGLAGQLGASE